MPHTKQCHTLNKHGSCSVVHTFRFPHLSEILKRNATVDFFFCVEKSDYAHIQIVGEQTYGKGLVQTIASKLFVIGFSHGTP